MSFYSDLAAKADALLTKFGQAVVITRKTSSTYDPSQGAAAVAEATQTGVAAIFDRSAQDINGTTIQAGDKQMILSAVGIAAPRVDDTVTLASSQTFTITSISTLSPGTEVVMYEANIRA